MKRKAILLAVAITLTQSPAHADVYVKVDANGNAIGGAIMCDAATCGAGSQYSQLTLGKGERYVLQGVGVDYGIGNNNPNTSVRHESENNQWVVTRNSEGQGTPASISERFTVLTPSPTPKVQIPESPRMETNTVINETSTAIVDTRTVTVAETSTAYVDYSAIDWETLDWTTFNWEEFLAWLTAYIEDLLAVKP